MLESAEAGLAKCGEGAVGRELKLKREALKLLLSSDYRKYDKAQVNLNELIHDLMLEKSSELSRRKIDLHSRFSAAHFIVPGNDSLISFIIGELLDKAAGASPDESEIVLLTGDRQRAVAVDIAFQGRAGGVGDFDVSILLPVMEVMGVSLQIETTGLDSYIFHIEYQIAGE
jgi:signal transduction histidine kinase